MLQLSQATCYSFSAGVVPAHSTARAVLSTGIGALATSFSQQAILCRRTITAREKGGRTASAREGRLYDEAARIVVQTGQASISYLQRKMRIGFSRAARLVDMMEAEGLVSAGTGGKPREVLVGRDYFEEVDAQPR